MRFSLFGYAGSCLPPRSQRRRQEESSALWKRVCYWISGPARTCAGGKTLSPSLISVVEENNSDRNVGAMLDRMNGSNFSRNVDRVTCGMRSCLSSITIMSMKVIEVPA